MQTFNYSVTVSIAQLHTLLVIGKQPKNNTHHERENKRQKEEARTGEEPPHTGIVTKSGVVN